MGQIASVSVYSTRRSDFFFGGLQNPDLDEYARGGTDFFFLPETIRSRSSKRLTLTLTPGRELHTLRAEGIVL